MKKKITLALLGILSAAMLTAAEKGQDSWEIFNMPGDYENPGVIKVVPGEVQSLTFYFMTPKSVLSAQTVGAVLPKGEVLVSQETRIIAKARHRMLVDMTFPAGMEWLDSRMGMQAAEKNSHKYQVTGRRVADRFICDKAMLQPQGSKSEWKTYKIAVRVSEKAPGGEEIFTLAVSHEGKPVVKKSWKIERIAKFEPAPKLKHLKIGFWDYGNYVLKKVHPELVRFWKHAGANCIFKTLENVDPGDFGLYGGLHHSYFKTASFPTYRPDGAVSSKELDGWYLRKHKLSEMLPNITRLQLEDVEKNAGWTGMDYEPSGISMGFIQGSIADFQKEYGVSKDEFETMRRGLAAKGYGYHAAASQPEREIFYKWNEYQSKLFAEYIKALAADLKKANPKAKMYNCTQDGLGASDVRGAGLCADDSLQSKYLDMLVPQIYSGYNEIAAKYVAIRNREWYRRIQKINPQCTLHSLLLVRYANGRIRNSPQWLRQQTIGAFAEGARGVSYYFIQDFNAADWPELAETVRQLAMAEDFYVGGKRCDEDFKIYGAPERVGYQPIWPGGKRKVVNPDWHMTAHRLGERILVTIFNYNARNDLKIKLESKHAFEKIDHGKQNADGSFLIPKNQTAYLYFRKK